MSRWAAFQVDVAMAMAMSQGRSLQSFNGTWQDFVNGTVPSTGSRLQLRRGKTSLMGLAFNFDSVASGDMSHWAAFQVDMSQGWSGGMKVKRLTSARMATFYRDGYNTNGIRCIFAKFFLTNGNGWCMENVHHWLGGRW